MYLYILIKDSKCMIIMLLIKSYLSTYLVY